ncbi:MAG: DUF433 domain-containing protein [Planctomycetota bacterium]
MNDRIIVDPGVLTGKPIVRGTRLAVEFIVARLGDGWTIEQLVAEFPGSHATMC